MSVEMAAWMMTGGAGTATLLITALLAARGEAAPGVLPAAARIGRPYVLQGLLGVGGMGEVHRARDRHGRPVAVKLAHDCEGPTCGSSALQNEIAVLEALSDASPLVPRFHEAGITDEGTPYLMMEIVHGCDLDELVRTRGALPAGYAADLLRAACDAVAAVHDGGYAHRDIKPSNLLLVDDGSAEPTVRVIDFGLSTPLHDDGTPLPLDSSLAISGSPAFMAPEVVMDGRADERSDIYALGCVAYWLLTGVPVFEGRSAAEILSQHLHRLPAPVGDCAAFGVSAPLQALVMDCLAKDPEDRPADVAALRARIAACPEAA